MNPKIPYELGIYKSVNLELIEYLGCDQYAPSRRRKDTHRYRAKCLHCGDVFEITSAGIASRMRNKVQKCRKCSESAKKEGNRKRASTGYPRHKDADLFAWGHSQFNGGRRMV